MTSVDIVTSAGRVCGDCHPRFEPVLDAFVANFNERGEAGASVSISAGGLQVVDLWGGVRDMETGAPWERDTISIIFSNTKAATALCAHMLIERGLLNPHAPVTDYWPEFGRKGKDKATVLMMLNHSVGLPALRAPVKPGGFLEWDYVVKRLEEEEPFWEPGTRNGYHMITFGWTVGELVRRVSGKSLGTFFREEVAEPLGLDFWIGLPAEHEDRVAPMKQYAPAKGEAWSDFTTALLTDPSSIAHLSVVNNGGLDFNARETHAAEIGGAGGISNARGLAGMYVPLANGGSANGVSLLSADYITKMRAVSVATQRDATLLIPTRFGQGFMLSMDNRHRPFGHQESCVIGKEAFGHVGAGGSIGFADPECNLAFAYTMTKMGAGVMLNERGQSLIDAAYKCLGYRTDGPGAWVL